MCPSFWHQMLRNNILAELWSRTRRLMLLVGLWILLPLCITFASGICDYQLQRTVSRKDAVKQVGWGSFHHHVRSLRATRCTDLLLPLFFLLLFYALQLQTRRSYLLVFWRCSVAAMQIFPSLNEISLNSDKYPGR
jgi:hypothetical protein